MSRVLRLLGLVLGIAVLAWLLAQADLPELLAILPRIGWGFFAILAVRAATIAINTAAWRCLMPRQERPSFSTMMAPRWIGEAINTTLPVGRSAAMSCAPCCCNSTCWYRRAARPRWRSISA